MLWFLVRRRTRELVHDAVEVHPKLFPVAALFKFKIAETLIFHKFLHFFFSKNLVHVDADPAVRVEVDGVAGEHFLLPLVAGQVKALGSKLKFKLVFF